MEEHDGFDDDFARTFFVPMSSATFTTEVTYHAETVDHDQKTRGKQVSEQDPALEILRCEEERMNRG